jgi:hypothetical protein
LIERSQLARGVKEEAERVRIGAEKKERATMSGKQTLEIWKKTPDEIIKTSNELLAQLKPMTPDERGSNEELNERGRALVAVIGELVQTERDTDKLSAFLAVNDRLTLFINGEDPFNTTPDGPPGSPIRPDKGKGRARETLSPSFSITDSDDEEHDTGIAQRLGLGLSQLEGEEDAQHLNVTSPTDLSKVWVEEEGEVFRKGTVLLGPDEMEEGGETTEVSGEILKREILETEVERPRRNFEIDAEGNPVPGSPTPREEDDIYVMATRPPPPPTFRRQLSLEIPGS